MMYLGIDDAKFLRESKIPMTKREIRILTLVLARAYEAGIIVDIGAGTGSISIEAAKFVPDGNIFAIERNPDAVELMKKNLENFAVDNITVINSEASEALKNFSAIDVAIIGGSGGKLKEILDIVDEKLKVGGRIAANFISIQNLAKCLEWTKNHKKNYRYETIQVQVNHLRLLGEYDVTTAANPIYILIATKKS